MNSTRIKPVAASPDSSTNPDSRGGKLFTKMAEGQTEGSMVEQIEDLKERPRASRKQVRMLPASGKGGEPVTLWGPPGQGPPAGGREAGAVILADDHESGQRGGRAEDGGALPAAKEDRGLFSGVEDRLRGGAAAGHFDQELD